MAKKIQGEEEIKQTNNQIKKVANSTSKNMTTTSSKDYSYNKSIVKAQPTNTNTTVTTKNKSNDYSYNKNNSQNAESGVVAYKLREQEKANKKQEEAKKKEYYKTIDNTANDRMAELIQDPLYQLYTSDPTNLTNEQKTYVNNINNRLAELNNNKYTAEVENIKNLSKKGGLAEEDQKAINQWGVFTDNNGNVADVNEYKNNVELYNNTATNINKEIEQLNKDYTDGLIGYDILQARYNELKSKWDENESVGNNLRKYQVKQGFDWYDWAKEKGQDVSEFEKYVESMNDPYIERLGELYGASLVDLLNTPIQAFEILKTIGTNNNINSSSAYVESKLKNNVGTYDTKSRTNVEQFDFTDKNTTSSKLSNYANELREYALVGTGGGTNWSLQCLSSLMPMVNATIIGIATGGALGVADVTNFASAFTNVALGAQTAGQVTRQRIEEGNDLASAVSNGVAHGIITGLVEGLDAGRVASVFTGKAERFLLSSALMSDVNYWNLVKYLNAIGASEGAEEIIEAFADNIVDKKMNELMGTNLNVESLDPTELTNQFIMAYTGALLLGVKPVVNVTINTKAKYNSAMEAIKYCQSVIDSSLSTMEEKQLAQTMIDTIRYDSQEYVNKTQLGNSVEFANEQAQPLPSFEEAVNNLTNALRQDVQGELANAQQLLDTADSLRTDFQNALNERGINYDAESYLNLSANEKDNIRKMESAKPGLKNINIAYDSNMADNGFIVKFDNGKPVVVVNPKGEAGGTIALVHEVIHSIQNTKEWNDIVDIIYKVDEKGNISKELLADMNKLGRGAYKGSSQTQLMKEAVAKKASEEVLNSDEFLDHIAKYNTSLAYKLYYKFSSMVESFGNESDVARVTRKLTEALSNQQEIELNEKQYSHYNYGVANEIKKIAPHAFNRDYTVVGTYNQILNLKSNPRETRYVMVPVGESLYSLGVFDSEIYFDSDDLSHMEDKPNHHMDDLKISDLLTHIDKYAVLGLDYTDSVSGKVNKNIILDDNGKYYLLSLYKGKSNTTNIKEIKTLYEFGYDANTGISNNKKVALGYIEKNLLHNRVYYTNEKSSDFLSRSGLRTTEAVRNSTAHRYVKPSVAEKSSGGLLLNENVEDIYNKIVNTPSEEKANIINSDYIKKYFGDNYKELTSNIKNKEDAINFADKFKEAIERKPIWDSNQKEFINELNSVAKEILGEEFNFEKLDLKKNYKETVGIDSGAKSIKSAVTKVMSKRYSLNDIKDQNRATINLPDYANNIAKVVRALKKHFNANVEVFDGSSDFGYTSVYLTFTNNNGIKTEIQISPDFDTKLKSDDVYEKWRRFDKNALTEDELEEYYLDVKRSKALWKSVGITPEVIDIIKSSLAEFTAPGLASQESILTQDLDSGSNLAIIQPKSDNNNSLVSSSRTIDNPFGIDNISLPPSYNNIVTQNEENSIEELSNLRDNYKLDTQNSVQVEFSRNTQQFAENNIPKSAIFTEEQKEQVRKEVADGKFTYVGLSNSEEVQKASARLESDGVENAYTKFMNNNKPTPQSVIDGELLVAKLAQNNDARWEDVAIKLADDSSITAQTLQAYAIMQRLTPQGQLVAIERNMNKMQQDLNNRFGNRRAPRLEISQELRERLLTAKDIESLVEAREAIYKDLTDKVPRTLGDTLDSWRYLAMLGNPRTHIRNFVGNGIFLPVVDIKNAIGTVLESLAKNKLEYRTKSLGLGVTSYLTANAEDKARIEAGQKAYDLFKGAIENDQKYERKDFTEKTVIGKGLNKASSINSTLLDKEDFIFSKDRFARSYASFMKANNLTVDNMDADMQKRASNYALIEAQKATYRDANAVAEWFNELEYSNKPGLKLASFAKKAVIPFTKTPMNIIKRGVEYSPVGLIKTLSYGINQLNSGKITANEFIDQLASGMTGTYIAGLGWLLSRMGLFRTKDEDKDRKKYFDEDNGEQDYSIVTDKGSYTIDWATPIIMPLSLGAEIENLLNDFEGIRGVKTGFNAFIDVLSRLADPMVETTMLSGVKDSLSSFANSEGKWLGDMLMSAFSNYVGQMFPTIGGQIARTIDEVRRTTYPNSGSFDKLYKTVLNKIPLLSKKNQPYINRKGEIEKNEDLGMGVVGRGILNFFSPGYYSSNNIDKYDEEMYRLLETTGNYDALPSNSSKSVTFDKELKNFSDEEFTKWQQTRWSTEKKYVDEFIDSPKYKSLTDEERVETIADIRSYAQKIAKKEFLDNLGEDLSDNASYNDLLKQISKVEDAEDVGIDIYEYFDYKNNAGSKQKEKVEYLENSNLTQKQKEYLFDLEGYKKSYADVYAKVMSDASKTKTSAKTSKNGSSAIYNKEGNSDFTSAYARVFGNR